MTNGWETGRAMQPSNPGAQRRLLLGVAVCPATIGLALAGCGSSAVRGTTVTTTNSAARSSVPAAASRLPEVWTVPLVGRFEGRCPPGAGRWMLRFVAGKAINDFISYRLGRGPRRTVNLRPAQALTWRLRPGTFRSHEPGFRQVPGDPTTRSSRRVAYLTTTPLRIVISQGSEPQIFRVDARLALAAAIDDTTSCALIDSRLRVLTYLNGGQPQVP